MKTTGFPSPINEPQKLFRELCEKGGGPKGGPPRTKLQEVLRTAGQTLNAYAYEEVADHMAKLPHHSPWHICYAIGLSWGHLAKFDLTFTEAAANTLRDWNSTDLSTACSFHMERGPQPIHDSLAGGRQLFELVTLPPSLSSTLDGVRRAQERWLSPILSKQRPKYIGSWNATAMFMIALFAQPKLAATLQDCTVMLPPGGPIYAGLKLLRKVHMLSADPAGSELDDEAFEPGAIYENNGLMMEILKGRSDWSMIDVHSGLYMLGTRHPHSATYFQ